MKRLFNCYLVIKSVLLTIQSIGSKQFCFVFSSMTVKMHFLWFMLELAVKKELTSFVWKALQVLVDQSKKANSPLKGHERTVQYLQHLGECGKEQYFCEVFVLVWWLFCCLAAFWRLSS